MDCLNNTHQLLHDLSALPLKMLDIRFMGTALISLEEAKAIIPTLQEIYCDIRTGEAYEKYVLDWVTKSLTA